MSRGHPFPESLGTGSTKESTQQRACNGRPSPETNLVMFVAEAAVGVIPELNSGPCLNGFCEPELIAEPLEQMVDRVKEQSDGWTNEDKKTFTHQYVEHGKNFLKISEALAEKTAADCIRYYYLTKHAVLYKKLKLQAHKVGQTIVKRKNLLEMGGKPPKKRRRNASKDK